VRTLADAHKYLQEGPMASYQQFGFGLYLVQLKAGEVPIGMCGLIKRPSLTDVDIGFAFLPQFRGQGYAFEAATAVLNYAKTELGLKRIVAITAVDNLRSIKLLENLGLHFQKMVRLGVDEPEIKLFTTDNDHQ
jgi:RimJ/RimL family protein N-acetyltransferase